MGGQIKIVRYGFTPIPDFGAHFYGGISLSACAGVLLSFWRKLRRAEALRGNTTKSRVEATDGLLLTQPYAPDLFRQGVLSGLHLFHDALMQRMALYEGTIKWEQLDKGKEMI